MALQALRKFSIDDLETGRRWDFDQGDTIPEDAQHALPAGRLESLRNTRHVLHIGEDLGAAVEKLTARVRDLEDHIGISGETLAEVTAEAATPKTRTPRKRKAA